MEEKKYNVNKTIEKFLIALVEVLLSGLIVYFTENGMWLVLIPVLEALRNFLKHKYGIGK